MNKSPGVHMRYYPIIQELKWVKNDKSIIEIGSGSLGIAPYLNRAIVGVDINFTERVHHNLKQIKASADKLPFEDKSFDYVICVDVLEHIHKSKREKVVKEIIRIGKEKAYIAFPVEKRH